MACIRIVCMDFYMSSPVLGLDVLNSDFRGSPVSRVPVLRIFGSTNDGHKACLHVHGVFPYIYIPYDGADNPNSTAYQIASALDKSINISMGQVSSNQQHVYKISLVSAIPFYGYHAREHQFLKIMFYNPMVVKKACALLENGSVLSKVFQPHESHIPYHQQFMIDYNLHGMNFVRLSRVTYRIDSHLPENAHVLQVNKQSVCRVELDAAAEDIVNRLEISQGKITANPGIQYICEDEKRRRRRKGIDTQMSPCLTQNRIKIDQTPSHRKYARLLQIKLENNSEDPAVLPDSSVYAAETPDSQSILSASSVLDNSYLDVSHLDNVDEKISSSLEEDVHVLADLLRDNHVDVEEDSILSQNVKADDDDENEPDLLLPLASVTTPVKELIGIAEDDEDGFWNDSFFGDVVQRLDEKTPGPQVGDQTLLHLGHDQKLVLQMDDKTPVPQVDGPAESSSEDDVVTTKPPRKRKRHSNGCFPALDLTVHSPKKSPRNNKQLSSNQKHIPTKTNERPRRTSIANSDVCNLNANEEVKTEVKRKLSFVDLDVRPLDRTVTQETVVCRYTPSKGTLSSRRQTKDVQREQTNIDKVPANGLSARISEEASKNDETMDKTTETAQNIFASKDLNVVSDKYDMQSKFMPVAGHSRTWGNDYIVSQRKTHTCSNEATSSSMNAYRKEFTRYPDLVETSRMSDEFTRNLHQKELSQHPDLVESSSDEVTSYQKESGITRSHGLTTFQKSNLISTSYQKVLSQNSDLTSSSSDLVTPYQIPTKHQELCQNSDSTGTSSNPLTPLEIPTTSQKEFSQNSDVTIRSSSSSLLKPFQIPNKHQELSQNSDSTATSSSNPLTPLEVLTTHQQEFSQNSDTTFKSSSSSLLTSFQIPKGATQCSSTSDDVLDTIDVEFNTDNDVDTICDDVHKIDDRFTIGRSLTPLRRTVDGLYVLAPKRHPPSRNLIESTMRDHKIPMIRHQDAFYGDVKHVTGPVEVGHRVLKIPSHTILDLPDFETIRGGLMEYQRREVSRLYPDIKSGEIAKIHLSHAENKLCVLTQVSKPPSRRDVEFWAQAKRNRGSKKKVAPEERRVKKLLRPTEDEGSDDSEMSLTLSSYSPIETTVFEECGPLEDSNDLRRNNEQCTTSREDLRHGHLGDSEDLKGSTNQQSTSPSGEQCATSIQSKTDTINTSTESKHEMLIHDASLQNILFGQVSASDNSHMITCATLNNIHGFKMSLDNFQGAKQHTEHQYLTTMVVEVHVQTRADFKPDPQYDAIKAVFYSIHDDVPEDFDHRKTTTGILVVNPSENEVFNILGGTGVSYDVTCAESENELYLKFFELFNQWNPDILVGYEIEMLSWGYLVERGYTLGLNCLPLLSRIPDATPYKHPDEELHTDLKVIGRVVLDLWRLMRYEIALTSYTFENVVYHVLHERVPLYTARDLTNWWQHRCAKMRHRVNDFYIYRVKTVLRLVDHFDLIGRTSELARLFGILFYEVFSRGSQFRVESMMLRLAKPMNFVPASPSVQQRSKMRAPEYLPLILEPESKFYVDPVIVLDFQSLYPSMIIAYNYCFSTCIGRTECLGTNTPFEFGATQLKISKTRVKQLANRRQLNFSPCGVAFVTKEVRHGILPRMLQEILDTRLLVKKAMKDERDNKTLRQILHSRQLGLKLIANVTYGYTAANFSGRMPAVEIADSVVSKGRETLQRAISLVERNMGWGARVVYGDTDSLFVLVAGKSREDAFKIGAEIAEAVTEDNPSPVRLKLEKVYQPCILQTKKRYVGYMYETPERKDPDFEAKGIETVRRDGCPAVAKMLEKCLRLLFETRNVSLVRTYVLRQFHKLMSGRVSVQDLTFAKEYRGTSGYKAGACVPALELARKWKAADKRNEPRSGQRVPYVIINGPPGLPLIRLVRSPWELLEDHSLRPNALYYITKVIIPPINRCFMLLGADLHAWFNEMPRKHVQYLPMCSPSKGKKTTISQYFATTSCACCGQQTKEGLCAKCCADTQSAAVVLHEKVRSWERNYFESLRICQSCCGRSNDISCVSLDCPVLYRVRQTSKDLQQATFVRDLIQKLPELDF